MGATNSSVDIFIVGGGPAGLASAICAARKGFHVAVADPGFPPIDKACGEGLMPDAVAALETMGVTLDRDAVMPFRGVRFRGEDLPPIEAAFSGSSGLGVRRSVLHLSLVQRAAGLGVSLLWGSRVTAVDGHEALCQGRKITFRWLVGADGENSYVRRRMTIRKPRYEHIRFGYRQHFRVAPWSDCVEVYWARGAQIVAAPVAREEVCVAITSRDPHVRIKDALGQVPDLREHLSASPTVTAGSGARAALRKLPEVCSGKIALVGDASGSVDPITGEGLGLAFQQAAALAEALAAGNLHLYQMAHDRLSRIPRIISRVILTMDAHPGFQRRALRALAAEPQLFSRLLNTHVRSISPFYFGIRSALRLGLQTLLSTGQRA